MELIQIKEKNINTIIYLENKKYYGYQYIGNTIKSIDNLDTFTFFLLSDDYTILPKKGKYEVYLDNKTGLKHYFYNNIENIHLLFLNNGVYAINYRGNHNKLTNSKIFNIKNKIIICSFLGLMLAISNINKPNSQINKTVQLLIEDYEPSDIENMINMSFDLTKEEKEYLYNEQFINDILEVINCSYYEKKKLTECVNNINIISYNDKEHESQSGYYKTETPNTLYIKNYEGLEERKKATLAHEFAHLCQNMYGYNLIIEASADLIAKEYFYEDYNFGYYKQVKLLKKLMEIIGSEPIWYYNFTGDFSKIEDNVLPYLTNEEYTKFLNDLSFDYDNSGENILLNESKYKELNEILDILYYRIYKKDIKDDSIINLIEKDDKTLVRYYFNKSKINAENSYYLDYEKGTYEILSYKEAIDSEIIIPYTISYLEISNEAAFRIIEDNTYFLKRDIDYHSHSITIQYSRHESTKNTISATIDGIKYTEANVDDLAKDGIIDVTYYIIDRRIITSSEYENYYNDENKDIYFTLTRYVTMNENNIEYLIPEKTYLPTIDTRNKSNNEYVKKKKITYQ